MARIPSPLSRSFALLLIGSVVVMVALSGSSMAHATARAAQTHDALTVDQWVQSMVSPTPSARAGAAMAYDAADGYLLLFGGCLSPGDYWGHVCTALGDTWTFRNGVWTNITSSIRGPSPPPRIDAGIAYDSADGYVVMFGGYNGTIAHVLNDTWTFHAGQWTEQHPTVSPPARNGAGMAGYDAGHEVVLFGGDSNVTGQVAFFGDTWVYHTGEWSRLAPSSAPSSRYDVAMSYDPADQSVLLFGGWSSTQTQSFGDTWSFANGTWTEVSSPISPPAENTATMAFDPSRNLMVMTGGHVGENLSSLTWGFNASAGWQVIPAIVAPPARWGTSLGYDPASGVLWLFGGFAAYWAGAGVPPAAQFFDDTWFLETVAVVASVSPSFTVYFSGLSVAFRDESTVQNDTILWIAWTFGDGQSGSGPDPFHTYAAPGSYVVYENVTDVFSVVYSTHETVTVPNGGGTIASTPTGGSTDWAGVLVWFVVAVGAAVVVLVVLRWPPGLFGASRKP
jgi:hypothetical protein